VRAGLLESRLGIGSVVAELSEATKAERTQLLDYKTEQHIVEARKLGISLEDMMEVVSNQWRRLSARQNLLARTDRGGRSK
jgi:DNA-binding transcriptional regulator YhcF (GntR family)